MNQHDKELKALEYVCSSLDEKNNIWNWDVRGGIIKLDGWFSASTLRNLANAMDALKADMPDTADRYRM